jgi:hypothetical protein
MLSKPTGGTLFYSLSTSTGTATVSNFDGSLPRKVRVSVTGQPCVINFSNNKTASNSSDLLMPPGHVEHFSLNNTSTFYAATTASGYLTTASISVETITFQLVAGAGGNGWISFTPVA